METLTLPQNALLRRTITAQLSDDEHALFVAACERSGLDPFARHIYPVKRSRYNPETRRTEDTFSPEATIDGLRLTAERTGKYAGQLGPEWCGEDGQWRDIWTSTEPPVGCRVGILRSDFAQPVWGKALYSEFVQLVNGEPAPFWVKMAANQLAKCAEALGFRKAFPREFSGIYTSTEMDQSQNQLKPVANIDATPEPVNEHRQSIPVPLRQFVNRGTGDRTNVTRAFRFLEDGYIAAYGLPGKQMFDMKQLGLPRVFKTREECSQATVRCWLEMWAEIERGKVAEAA